VVAIGVAQQVSHSQGCWAVTFYPLNFLSLLMAGSGHGWVRKYSAHGKPCRKASKMSYYYQLDSGFTGVAMFKLVLPKEFKYLFLYLIAITAINLPHNTIVQIKHFLGLL
jgi:hypothetical protein